MPQILPDADIRSAIRVHLPQNPVQDSVERKNQNIFSFNSLSREGLIYGERERRLLLYTTQAQEKVYIQYPGIESARDGERRCPNDFRPVLFRADGTQLPDMDFKRIWDVIDRMGADYRGNIDILAAIFLRIAYMLDYHHNVDAPCLQQTIDISTGSVGEEQEVSFTWNSLALDEDVIATLQNLFSSFEDTCGVSLEGFLYYNDLLAQNEDCKYSFLKGEAWNGRAGRTNTCLSHLTVISHLRGYIGLSKLISGFSRGVAPLPRYRFFEACGNLVE